MQTPRENDEIATVTFYYVIFPRCREIENGINSFSDLTSQKQTRFSLPNEI